MTPQMTSSTLTIASHTANLNARYLMCNPDSDVNADPRFLQVQEYQKLFRLEGWMKSPYWGRPLAPKGVQPSKFQRCDEPLVPGTNPQAPREWYCDPDGNWFQGITPPSPSKPRSRPSTARSSPRARSGRPSTAGNSRNPSMSPMKTPDSKRPMSARSPRRNKASPVKPAWHPSGRVHYHPDPNIVEGRYT